MSMPPNTAVPRAATAAAPEEAPIDAATGQLRAAAKKHLRALGNPMQPDMRIGKERVTEGVISHLDGLLFKQELVKIKVLDAEAGEAVSVAEALCAGTDGQLVHDIGGTLLIFRRNRRDPVILLPGERRKKAPAQKADPPKRGRSTRAPRSKR